MKDIFKKRTTLKPHEYPHLAEYANSIRHSYWVHTEFNFTSDVNDYKSSKHPHEIEALRRAMLAIAQIEVNVKTFWGDIYRHMPKPEIGAVGFTFAESEVRHADAYSHLLEILGLNDEFNSLTANPTIKKRISYLNEIIDMSKTDDPAQYAKAILMFSLFIENVSLFSQFLIILAFNKFENTFKGMSNAVEATSKEEQIHALFGMELINIIREENPDWFGAQFIKDVQDMSLEALQSELEVVDWIYEAGDISFIPKAVVVEFIKGRMNKSLMMINIPPVIETDEALLLESDWFDVEVLTTKHTDFFYKRSINYNKRSQSISTGDLF